MYVLVVFGNPARHRYFGPFSTQEDARATGERLPFWKWYVAEVETIPDGLAPE